MSDTRCRYCFNPFWEGSTPSWSGYFPQDSVVNVRRFHESLPEYAPTPLVKLERLAARLGVGSILVKDESHRLGLNAFKGLGASYAIHKILQSEMQQTKVFSAATEGNHGHAVAWMAKKLGFQAVIYVPSHISLVRLEAIRRQGAKLVITEGSYEDSVRRMAKESSEKNCLIVSDVGYEGYTEIPKWITIGYFTLFAELEEQIAANRFPAPDFIFLQGGVGAFASSGIAYFTLFSTKRQAPIIVTVEPVEADCLLASAASPEGSLQRTKGILKTRMAGLNCGFPSTVAWPIIRSGASVLVAVDDEIAVRAAGLLGEPRQPDPPVFASESGAAGLAGLLGCCQTREGELPELLGLGRESCVLIVNTEGPEWHLSV